MFARLAKIVAEFLVSLLLGRRQQDITRADERSAGRSDGAVETQQTVSEVADEQARAAADRGADGVDALAAELRARAGRLAADAHGAAGAGRIAH